MQETRDAQDPRVNFLRVLAMLLIINTHLRSLYPLEELSFGSHIGNSLFYLVSGYGLVLSYRNKPISAGQWIKKRLAKLLLPLLIILVIINIGSWQSLKDAIYGYIVWHSKEQLNSFLPVLFILYVLFLPLMKIRKSYFLAILSLLPIVILGLFVYQARAFEEPAYDLLIRDYYFSANALICFMLGTQAGDSWSALHHEKIRRYRWHLIALLFVLQASHVLVQKFLPSLIILNFYTNILSVVLLFEIAGAFPLSSSESVNSFMAALAASTLASYLVHSKIIKAVQMLDMAWPYDVLAVFLYSFIAAYPLMKIGKAVAARILPASERGEVSVHD